MESIIKRLITTGIGAASIAKKRTDEVIKDLMESGKLSEEEGKRILNELDEEGEKQKKEFENEMSSIMEKILKRMNIPSHRDYEILEKRIEVLEKKQSPGEASK